MKRTLSMALILGLFATASMAAVESVNTVGYISGTVKPTGLVMVGVPMQSIGSTGTVNIQDLASYDGMTGFDWTTQTGGDKLFIWQDGQNYVGGQYTWVAEDTYGLVGEANVWCEPDPTFILKKATLDLNLGDAIWIQSSSAEITYSVNGEVPVSPSGTSLTLVEQLTMLSNPYPTLFDPNSATYAGLTGFDWTTQTGGDKLLIWDPVNDNYLGGQLTWVATDTYGLVGEDNVWCEPDPTFILKKSTITIPAGGAFWIQRSAAGTGSVTF